MKKVLILGYGLLGAAFSRLYGACYEIRGVRRTAIKNAPDFIIPMPIQSEELLPHLEWADILVFCPASGQRDLTHSRETYRENMAFVLNRLMAASLLSTPIILISSTGVYPRAGEETWSEEMAIPVETPRQEILLHTEQILRISGLPHLILRSGGLYGEERGYLYRVMQRGKIYTSEMSDSFVSSVHQDDLCGIIHQVISHPITGQIYNVVDHTEMQKKAWAAFIAREMGLSIEWDGAPAQASRRRISTEKLKKDLGYRFLYPTAALFLEEMKKLVGLYGIPSESKVIPVI